MFWFILSLIGGLWWALHRYREEARQSYLRLHPEAITDWERAGRARLERFARTQLAIDEAHAALRRQGPLDLKDDPLAARPVEPVSIALKPEPVTERPGPEPVVKPSALAPEEPPRLIGVYPDGRPRWSDE